WWGTGSDMILGVGRGARLYRRRKGRPEKSGGEIVPLGRRGPGDPAGGHCSGRAHKGDAPHHVRAVAPKRKGRLRDPFVFLRSCPYLSLAALRSASARSVFSHEKAVAAWALPSPSTYENSFGLRPKVT